MTAGAFAGALGVAEMAATGATTGGPADPGVPGTAALLGTTPTAWPV
jgi:hypothetical protein